MQQVIEWKVGLKREPVGKLCKVSLETCENVLYDDQESVIKTPLGVENDPLGFIQSISELGPDVSNAEDMKEMWNAKKHTILKKFSTNEFEIDSMLFSDSNDTTSEENTRAVSFTDRSKARLEHFEQPEKPASTIRISEKEYSDRVKLLQRDLISCWGINQRVMALRLAIKAFKLLGETTVPLFYPSLFVLVSDILDTFGNLVFERIKTRSSNAPDSFTSCNEISIEAKETCRNWFYKTACVREILPRIYVEICLLHSYRFISDSEYPAIISRLSSMIRGIGDPTVAVYTRMYLAITGIKLLDSQTVQVLVDSFQDYLFMYKEFKVRKMISYLRAHEIDETEFLAIHSPAVEWILKSIGSKADLNQLNRIFSFYKDSSQNTMVLYHILNAFPGNYYASRCREIVQLIQNAAESQYRPIQLYRALAKKLVDVGPPEADRIAFLNDSWKVIALEGNLELYIDCTAVYMDLIVHHYSIREVNILLGDIELHLNTAELKDLEHLENILYCIIKGPLKPTEFTDVITNHSFMTIYGMLNSQAQTMLAKDILVEYEALYLKNGSVCNDPSAIHTLFELARRVHDGLESLTGGLERQRIDQLIRSFISTVDFEDYRQQFNVYIDCRASFCQLDCVRIHLVHSVVRLALQAKHDDPFVKACMAYCHITIPSINNRYQQLQLLGLCAQVGLLTQSLSQTDSFLIAAISLIPQLTSDEIIQGVRCYLDAAAINNLGSISPDELLRDWITKLMSFLIFVPGVEQPETEKTGSGALYFIRGLSNASLKYQWKSETVPIEILLSLIGYYATCLLPLKEFTISKVESNDVLYAGSDEYQREVHEHFSTSIQDTLALITALGKDRLSLQNTLLLDLVNQLLVSVELSDGIVQLLAKICNRLKTDRKNATYYERTLQFIQSRANESLKAKRLTKQGLAYQKLAQNVVSKFKR